MTKLFEEALVLDTETTSLDFKVAEVIEYSSASVLTVVEEVTNETLNIPTELYNPSSPILPEVSAITNISNRMIEKQAIGPFTDHLDVIQKELDDHKYYIAHNAFYDTNVLEGVGLKMSKQLCTMRLAKKLYADDPAITGYGLAYLRYALDLPVPEDTIGHRANADVMMTGLLFVQLLAKAIELGVVDAEADDLGEQLVEYLAAPVIITKMPFGKHKGQLLTEVPISYWQWALENMDSLQEDKPEYDKDFATSVEKAVQEIFDKQS